MEKYQEIQLEVKLEELMLTGSTWLTWNQLYTWYRVERIGKAPYRDIKNRWESLCEIYDIEPPLIEVRGNNSGIGGIRLIRPYMQKFDGNMTQLDDLVSGKESA